MSVVLTFPYATFAAGATVTLDRATEASLVQQRRATYVSDPGSVFGPLSAVEQQALRNVSGALSSGAMYTAGRQTVAALGDSMQANAVSVTGGIAYFNLVQSSALNWACVLLKQAIWMPYGAKAGATTADIVNYSLAVSGVTSQSVIDNQIGPAAALGAGYWSVQVGTNDLTLLAADSAVTICGRIRTICQAGLAAGAKVILGTIPPRNDAQWTASNSTITGAGSTIAAQRAKHMTVNRWMREYAAQTPGIILSDPYDELVDQSSSTSDWIAAYTADGTHWSPSGAFVAGRVMANALIASGLKPAGRAGSSVLDAYSTSNYGGNLMPDAGLLGSVTVPAATGMSGNVPTNWAVNAQEGSATAVCSVGARTDALGSGVLVNGRRLTIAVSTAGASSRLRAFGSTLSVLVPANTPFYAEMEFEVTANSAAWDGPGLQVFFASPGGVYPQYGAIGLGALPVGALFSGVVRTPISSSTVDAGQLLFGQMLLRSGSAVTMNIYRMGVYTLDGRMLGVLLGAA